MTAALVVVKPGPLGEGLATHVALVRLVPRVNPAVGLQR